MSKFRIELNDFSTLKKFVHEVAKFESDVNIIKGRLVFDAKSLLGVIDIAPDSSETFVEIISDDQDEIVKFNQVMEEFRV